MKLGASDIAGFRVGATAVSRLYMGAALVWEADAPPPTLAFGARFPSWNAREDSASDTTVQVGQIVGMPLGGAAAGIRLMAFRLDNAAGKRPLFRVSRTPEIQWATVPENPVLTWSSDLDGDVWTPLGSRSNFSDRIELTPEAPFPTDTVYLATLPLFSWGRWEAAIDRWVSDDLTRPTPSAVSGYSIGTLPGFTTSWGGGIVVPTMTQRAFRFGTGPRHLSMTGIVHPDETPGAFAMEAAIDWALGDSPEAVAFRDDWTVTVYPNINSQGVYLSLTRSDPQPDATVDANRIWGPDVTSASPMKALYEAAFFADFTADGLECVIDFHALTASSSEPRVVYRRLPINDAAAVAAFDAEMTARGNYAPLISTAPAGISRLLTEAFGADLTLIHEHRMQGTVAAWREHGTNIIKSVAAITAEIWPDAPPALTVTPTADGFAVENLDALDALTDITPTSDGFTVEP